MSTTVVHVSDLHCGNGWSIQPREVVEEINGNEIAHPPNDLQLKLIEKWEGIPDDVGRINVVIANGDLCEGPNRKSYGLGNWTNNLFTQVLSAADLLASLKADKYYITEGSGYHVGDNPSLDKLVAEELKNMGFDAEYSTEASVTLKDDDYRIHANHWVGVSSVFHYRSTPIARELMNARLNQEEYGNYDGILRAHAHYYCYLEFGKQWGAVIPGWKFKDEYLRRKGLGYVPKIGYFAFEADSGELATVWKMVDTVDRRGLTKEFVYEDRS